MILQRLPAEILMMVFSYLDIRSSIRLSICNKALLEFFECYGVPKSIVKASQFPIIKTIFKYIVKKNDFYEKRRIKLHYDHRIALAVQLRLLSHMRIWDQMMVIRETRIYQNLVTCRAAYRCNVAPNWRGIFDLNPVEIDFNDYISAYEHSFYRPILLNFAKLDVIIHRKNEFLNMSPVHHLRIRI